MRKEPVKPELIEKILNEIKKNPDGIWIRKLSRKLNEPLATVYKYVLREDYCGKYITTEKSPQELGGHLMVKIKGENFEKMS
ncbi:MAG: hypothetical protein KKB03_01770 [Nanoarchaeota archaeon]|nr:hypothetical protein [Nanoarchaeota archaeon]MBU1135182.1 hypothetical protein [Nanoarchaeota archaeon]MBU2519954.1 hypothetical protein [Nanoarchaeota archaeon]